MYTEKTLNIIFDDRRDEKFPLLVSELRNQLIEDFRIWPAVVLRHSVVESINESHKMIVRWAKEVGLPYVIICEDDLLFSDIGAWQYYLSKMPQDFDLYLACTYVKPFDPIKITGFHLYTVAAKFYDTFLSAPKNAHIDVAMDDLGGDYHLCYPFPALQRAGYSSNCSGYANYNTVLEKSDIYHK
jgi:hypothetical protein